MLHIAGGLTNHQVFQRSKKNTADIVVSGVAPKEAQGTIYATVSRRGVPLENFENVEAGRAQSGIWSAEVADLPVGGPYRVDLYLRGNGGRLLAQTCVVDVLVGDLWILAGQSNMEGYGLLKDVEQSSGQVHSFDLRDQWLIAEEPLSWPLDAVDPIYWSGFKLTTAERLKAGAAERKNRALGAGLALPFAKQIVQRTGVPIGLIPCAYWGTSLSSWDPALRDQGGASLYGAMYRRFQAAGGRIKGVLWFQGEADANPHSAPTYSARFRDFITAVRKDFNQPDLPFYFVQLARWVTPEAQKEWTQIREAQRKLAAEMPSTGMAVSVDLPLEGQIHVDTDGLKRLGKRLANLALIDLYGEKHLKRGPALGSIEWDRAGGKIYVQYMDVNGRLQASGRLSGFTLHTPDCARFEAISKAYVDPVRPDRVVLEYYRELPPGVSLAYGYGTDPYCNLVDAADMAAPCFGPLPVAATVAAAAPAREEREIVRSQLR